MNKIIIIFLTLIMFKQIIFANTKEDTYINTTNIQYDEKNNIVQLSGNSKINIGETNILVDRGIIDYNKDEIKVFGNFYLYQELNILSGKDLKGNTNLTNFKATEVSYIYNNDLKIDSNEVERSDDIVIYYNNFVTPCELEGYFNCPTWSLRIDKTKYNIQKDKFVHYDTFLQIADYKLFYLPYFSHYGSKAPRKAGFLTPTLQFTIGGNSGLKTPYYLPFNQSSDVTITPTWLFNENFEFLRNFNLNTYINTKTSGGISEITIDNIKNTNSDNINNSIKLSTKQVLSKNLIFSANGLFTNSISTSRSINEEPITFENMFIKLENYNLISNNDYIKGEVATVKSFDISDTNQIPLSPNISYHNRFDLFENASLQSNIDYRILNRDSSKINNPSKNYIMNLNNYLSFNKKFKNIQLFNKISSLNSINDYEFNHDPNLDRQEKNSFLILSSDSYLNSYSNIKPRIKFIYFQDVYHSDDIINEDSNAVSFNYINQYSDSRLFGNNLPDNSSRIVYGLENSFNINSKNFKLNFNQSYDINKNNNFATSVNQFSNFSDYSIELKTDYNDINFQIDMRVDENSYSRKEMNYSLYLDDPITFGLNYHETSKNAYSGLSNDTKSLGLEIAKNINDNVILSYTSSLDLKNEYSPYKSDLTITLFDECSKLDVTYTNTRFNDNYNTTPEEKVSITFAMDYLGFFGYEQKTDLFFNEPGDFNYGL